MSATGRGAIRVENDFYRTDENYTRPFFEHVNWDRVATAFEPCKGDGAIYNLIAARLSYPSVEWAEIREGRNYLVGEWPQVDFSPSNPPYSLATEFLQKAFTHCRCVAYLLRLNYLGSAKRKAFLSANRPTHIYTLCERPSFVDVCKGIPETKTTLGRKGCGNSFQKKDAVKVCPTCGGHVSAGTDATEYAWICWDGGGIMLDAPGIYFL